MKPRERVFAARALCRSRTQATLRRPDLVLGTICQRHPLSFGNPDNVAREVRERIATIGRGGGLIIGPTHCLQLDTPMEGFWTMVKTIRETPYTEIRA